MKKLSIDMSNDKYFDCVSGKVNGKDLADCNYEDIYDFFKGMDLRGRDLSNFNLAGADLSGSDLSFANFENANLEGANLTGAMLYKANLSNVSAYGAIFKCARIQNCMISTSDIEKADFTNAMLIDSLLNGSTFRWCNFTGAGFYGSSLLGCDFRKTNMTSVRMNGTNLANVNFSEAVLKDTNFELANLYNATFDRNPSTKYKFGKILDAPIIGYKKAIKDASIKIDGKINNFMFPVLVTLEIPKGAIVFSVNGSKCRTNKAIVTDIEYMVTMDDYLHDIVSKNEECTMISEVKERPVRSMHDNEFYYIKGETIEVNNFDLQYNVECGNGIHFFMKKTEAINFRY